MDKKLFLNDNVSSDDVKIYELYVNITLKDSELFQKYQQIFYIAEIAVFALFSFIYTASDSFIKCYLISISITGLITSVIWILMCIQFHIYKQKSQELTRNLENRLFLQNDYAFFNYFESFCKSNKVFNILTWSHLYVVPGIITMIWVIIRIFFPFSSFYS